MAFFQARGDVEQDGMGQQSRDIDSASMSSPRTGVSRSSTSETASLHSARKRLSLFGRSNSDASSMRRAPATSHSSRPSFGTGRIDEEAARPTTSRSIDSRRRKTDPLQSIRDSLFGGKKKGSKDINELTSSQASIDGHESLSGPYDAPVHPTSYRSEEEYYRHLRKHSISPPFNFQHVTHTARNQLPTRLETVDEKDLPGQFWSVAAYQRPRRRVHGIKVDDLEVKHRQMGLIRESPEPSPAFSPPTSPPRARSPRPAELAVTDEAASYPLRLISPLTPVSPLDAQIAESVPQEVEAPLLSPGPAISPKSFDVSEAQVPRHPKRHSSLSMMNQHLQPRVPKTSPPLRSAGSFYDSNSSSESVPGTKSPKRRTESTTLPQLNASMPPNFSSDYNVAFRSRQPLPSLPPHLGLSTKQSLQSLQVDPMSPATMLSPTLPPTKPASPKSRHSSRSSRSTKRSPGLSRSSTDLRKSSKFSVSDVSWEDSVDLAYEEEAESTCDFAWNGQQQLRKSSSHSSEGKRDSAGTSNLGEPSRLSNGNESLISLYKHSSTDTISERKTEEHKRGTSVGHRGFLAARKNSSTPDLLAKAKEPPAPLVVPQGPTPVSVLSPVFSVAEEDSPKTPFGPELHYPRIEPVSNDYLSDPESYRNSQSSKHRKSSSYGSYGSSDSAGAKTGPPSSSANTTRWSIASSGSMPELMHSRPKSKSSLSRSVTSQPLEPLPQSPPGSGGEADPELVPRSQPGLSTRNSAASRQSGESADRFMQAIGRSAQRGRPGSYARYSQHLEPNQKHQTPPYGGVRESYVGGPDWI